MIPILVLCASHENAEYRKAILTKVSLYRTIQNMKNAITREQYDAFQRAYDFFNKELFAASLPAVLVTLQRHAKAYGYFSPERFVGRNGQEAAHELALNPDHFGRTDEEILSTLVHEMCHVWQQTHGTPPRAITIENGQSR